MLGIFSFYLGCRLPLLCRRPLLFLPMSNEIKGKYIFENTHTDETYYYAWSGLMAEVPGQNDISKETEGETSKEQEKPTQTQPIGEHNAEIVEHLLSSYVEGNKPSAEERRFLDTIAEQKKVNKAAFTSQWEGEESEESVVDPDEIEQDPAKKILWAAETGKLDIVRDMLANDLDLVHSVDEDLYTPLHRASYNGHVELCRLLLESGAKYDAKTRDGWIPLHCACRWNKVDVASILLQVGSDVNALTNGKQTPLHLAASNGQAKEVLQLLLMNRWIDPTVVNDGHDTPYDVCKRSGTLYHMFEVTQEHMLPTKKEIKSSESTK